MRPRETPQAQGCRRAGAEEEEPGRGETCEEDRPRRQAHFGGGAARGLETGRGSLHLARPDGNRCGSAWKVELDHIRPAALGGPSTVENLRILCRAHNTLSAEHAFGRAHMERFRAEATRTGEVTAPGGSGNVAQPKAIGSVVGRALRQGYLSV